MHPHKVVLGQEILHRVDGLFDQKVLSGREVQPEIKLSVPDKRELALLGEFILQQGNVRIIFFTGAQLLF